MSVWPQFFLIFEYHAGQNLSWEFSRLINVVLTLIRDQNVQNGIWVSHNANLKYVHYN